MSEKYAVMPMDDYISACDTIKDKTGADDNHIKSGELPTKIDEVFEAGKKAELLRFWGIRQNYGEPAEYTCAFSYKNFTDETYDPQFPINALEANQMFMGCSLTDTKVIIDLSSQTKNRASLFHAATKLVTIRGIKSLAGQGWSEAFTSCKALKNITFVDGAEIGRNISFASSPLTPESMISVIEHLVNYSGTDNDHAYTVTFTDACWAALEEYQDAPDDNELTWRDYVDTVLGWNT